MTALKYIMESKLATAGELMAYKREDVKSYEGLLAMAKDEMRANNIVVDEPVSK